MTTTAQLSELDVARLSGLPGPLVHELVPHEPPDTDDYHCGAKVYPQGSVELAKAAGDLLSHGVRFPVIRAVMQHPAPPAGQDLPSRAPRHNREGAPRSWWTTPSYTRGLLTGL